MMQLDTRVPTQVMTTPKDDTSEMSTSQKLPETSAEMSTSAKATPVTSRVSNWLTAILYPLGSFVVLPFYFRKLTVVGQENLPKTGSVIIAPTSLSLGFFDYALLHWQNNYRT